MSTLHDHQRLPNAPRGKLRCVIYTATFVFFSLIRVDACPVCFLMPTKTAADFLIESELVVLARENSNRPFSYATVEILKGHTTSGEFGLFVDSITRRLLKANPKNAVLLVRKNKDEPWQSLGIAESQYQEVVKRILAFSGQWTGEGGSTERYKFFLSLFGSKNRNIFELSYLELGRAPYGTIKKIAKFVVPDDLRRVLHRREYFEWRPLAILLLAQSPGDQDRKLIENSFHSCHKFSLTTNLAAWATAYIELNGSNAVDEIEQTYLRDATRTDTEIRAIIVALSVHGRNGPTDLRDRIVESYGLALENHPQAVGPIVSDLTDWKKRVYRERIAIIIENPNFEIDTIETTDIKSYLR